MDEVNKAGKAKKLRGFEMLKSVLLEEEPWSGTPALPRTPALPCTHLLLVFLLSRYTVFLQHVVTQVNLQNTVNRTP